MPLEWHKDQSRTLRKRAIADDIAEYQKIAAFNTKEGPVKPSKAELRIVAEQAVEEHKHEPRGEWSLKCECGHNAKVKITFSDARHGGLWCPKCGGRERLSEDDLKPPWD